MADALWDALEETQLGSHRRSGFWSQEPSVSMPRVYFSVSSFPFRRLNDPSVVTPFSRDDRGHTPLHVAALCGMWSGFCALRAKGWGQGCPSRAWLLGEVVWGGGSDCITGALPRDIHVLSLG